MLPAERFGQHFPTHGVGPSLSACPHWNGSAPRRCAAPSITFRDTMKAHAAGINRLNVYPVPDGDTGTNMARTLDAVVAELDLRRHELEPTCNAISHGSLMGARGNSGVILSQILRGLVGTLKDATEAQRRQGRRGAEGGLRRCLPGGAEADRGHHPHRRARVRRGRHGLGCRRGQPGRHAARGARRRQDGARPHARAAARVEGCRRGRRRRRRLPAACSTRRCTWSTASRCPSPTRAMGRRAEQLEVVLASARDGRRCRRQRAALRGDVLRRPRRRADPGRSRRRGARSATRSSWSAATACGTATCTPTTSVRRSKSALELDGRPKQIRVTDLFEEMAEEHAAREAAIHGRRTSTPGAGFGLPAVTCAVVAVASGDGLAELFGQLGVQGVVTGGQTLNPSTAELLAAVEAVNARAGHGAAQQQEHHPGRRAARCADHQDGSGRAHHIDAGGARRTGRVRPGGRRRRQPRGDDRRRRVGRDRRDHAGGARHQERRRRGRRRATGSGWSRGDGIVAVSGSLDGAACALLDHLVTPGREIVTVITGSEADCRPHRRAPGVARSNTVPMCRSRCTAAASRCTRTSSALND